MTENGTDANSLSREKDWERPWTTDEMRQSAHAWNLAGDSGLLKHLQKFSQTVLSHTHATEKALDSLVEEINTAASEITTTNNKFLCLANTQFVENRVYDDDEKESPQDVPVPDKKSKEETEASMLKKVREALSLSVAVLDTMFEPVEIQASDSEMESEDEKHCTKTLLLEPHNPYMHRPLPHLIGSEAFMSDDHIGLGDSPSDGEEQLLKTNADEDMDVSSESDVEFMNIGANKRSRDMYSSPSSASDSSIFPEKSGKHSKKTKPIDSSQDLGFHDEATLEKPANSSTHLAQDNSFAAQLAAKLDKIAPPPTSSNSAVAERINEKKSASGDLFGGSKSEDDDDALFAKGSGFFSSRPKLFDDLEDTNKSLWGSESQDIYKSTTSIIRKTEHIPGGKDKSQLGGGGDIFSRNMSDDEDDLFSSEGNKASNSRTPIQRNVEASSKSSGISSTQILPVAGSRPDMATSTPEKETQAGLFDEASRNVTKSISTMHSVPGGGFEKNEQLVSNNTMKENEPSSHDKKPAGGVPMFGQSAVLAGLKAKLPLRRHSSSESDSSAHDPQERSTNVLTKSAHPPSVNDHPVNKSENVGSISSSSIGSFQHRLSTDDDHQSRNMTQPVSSIPNAYSDNGDSDGDDLFSNKTSKLVSQKQQEVSGGLFADVNDEDDLFAVGSTFGHKSKKEASMLPESLSKAENAKPAKATVTNENEKVSQQGLPKLSPPSAVAATNSNSSKVSLDKGFSRLDQARHDIFSTVPPPLKTDIKVKKPVSLFDDSDSGEDELLFSSASSAGSRRSQASSDLLATSASVIEKKPLSKKGLFDDDDALFGNNRNDPDIDIFGGSKKAAAQHDPVVAPSSKITAAPADKHSTVQNVISTSSEGNSSDPRVNAVISNSAKGIFQDDLFADNDDEEDDLFSKRPKPIPLQKDERQVSTQVKDDVDDLFSGTFERIQQKNELKSPQPTSQEAIQPKTEVVQPRSLKPSLTVMSEAPLNTVPESTNNDNGDISEKKLNPTKDHDESNSVRAPTPQMNYGPKPDIQPKPIKPQPPKTLDIRKETDPALGLLDGSDDEDDDLFGSSTLKVGKIDVPPPNLPTKPIVASKPHALSDSKINLPKSDAHELHAENNDTGKEKSQASEVDGSSVSVSNFKYSQIGKAGLSNIKIDPKALLPGGRPPPRRTPPKEDTSEPLSSLGSQGQLKSHSHELSVGFDEPASNNATLPSANKARAKLGVKRRPPSSKARREAARASQNYDQSDKEIFLSPDISSPADPVNAVSISVTSSNSVLSPSTDEDDLFGVPQDLPPEYGQHNVPAADIFMDAPILSPLTSVERTKQLFLDSQEKNSADQQKEQESVPHSRKKQSLFLPFEDSDESSGELSVPTTYGALSSELLAVEGTIAQVDLTAVAETKPQLKSSSKTESPQETEKFNESQVTSPEIYNSLQSSELLNPNIFEGLSTVSSSMSEDMNSLKIATETASGTLKTSMPQNDQKSKFSGRNVLPDISNIDPLNKADQSSKSDEDQLFDSDVTEDTDDHNSMFPFVKKKPESKLVTKRPLFSQTPILPSKDDKSMSKTRLGAFDDVEDNDLFPPANKLLPEKKTGGSVTNAQSKDAKIWRFSDDDEDDDLFLSGSKPISSGPLLSKTSSSVPAQKVLASLHSSQESSAKPSIGVKKPKAYSSIPRNGLFSDDIDDDNDDLFSKSSQLSRNKVKEIPPTPKSSLFDDEDNDLFASPVTTSKKGSEQNQSKNSSNTAPQPLASSKLKKEAVFDDPLMALQDDT